MILVKATGRVLKLSQCGIAVEKRFAFYDQIHTTGMDIKHCLSARAALTLGKDMVFRDLAQGAFRMRGIGEGQTVTLLVIPEVQELMHRQLAKAGCRPPAGGGAGGGASPRDALLATAPDRAARQRMLRDVAAWLVINSMQTERVQFDQLCYQNLANLWRQNAFDQLVAGHQGFRVQGGAHSGYVVEALGEAFLSNREGAVSRAKLDGKLLALYFLSAPASAGDLQRALREVYEGDKLGEQLEVVLISSAATQEEFVAQFREMPWLAVPFTHAQRRLRLRQLFEVNPASMENVVVLVDRDGQTITRDGAILLELAYSCASALRAKAKNEKRFDEEREQVETERKRLSEQLTGLKPLEERLRKLAAKLGALKPKELAEIGEFVSEPAISAEAQAALDEATATLEAAKAGLRSLTDAQLEHMRSTDEPSASLRAAVEAACVMLDTKPDFAGAQSRLMRSAHGLTRRLLSFDLDTIPKAAPNRLRRFLGQPPPDAAEEPVAHALRGWVVAALACDAANDEAKMTLEQHSCTLAMQTACECVCDLYGLHGVEEDLRGVLLMAKAFPPKEPAAASSSSSSEGANGSGGGVTDQSADEHEAEQQLQGLQQKVYRLRQFMLMLQKDMETSSHLAGPKRDEMRGKMGYLNDRYTFNTALAGNAGDDLFKAMLTALMLMMQPEALQKESDVFKAAALWIAPMKRDHWDKFYAGVRGMEGEINEGRTKPEDWAKVKGIAEHIAQNCKGHRFRAGSQLSLYLCEWIVAASAYNELSSEMAAKKVQFDALKKELGSAQKELDDVIDRGDQPDGLPPTLIKTVSKAAREAGMPVRREQVVWALKRANGHDGLAAEMITSQPAAHRARAALDAPAQLAAFVDDAAVEEGSAAAAVAAAAALAEARAGRAARVAKAVR